MTRRDVLKLPAAFAAPAPALWEPHQLDFHFHSGMEREEPIERWLNRAVAAGRRALLMVDHLELYRPGDGHRLDNYPISPAGRRAFLDDVERMKKRRDALIFSGWEVYEGELDTGIEWDAMRQVEAVGWHISHLKGKRPPDGKLLVHRARQIKELQKQLPVPMILLHPFSPRIEGLRRARDPKTISGADYQYFHGDEHKQLIDLLADSSIYIEINHSSMLGYWDEPVLRDALVAAIRPLAEAGLQFSLGSDHHSLRHTETPYRPEIFCDACSIRP
ncbi:MAG: hypothetical protein HY238_28095, partial [Acidobacteria bacterium]|nr:hypothetical protein [Acidobacteriota bacterium]